MKGRLAAAAAFLLLAAQAWPEDSAKGALTVAGQKLTLSHVYAYATTGVFDKTKNDVVVILSDVPIPAAQARNSLMLEEKVPQFLSITLDAGGQIISLLPQHKAFKMVPSGASSDFIFEKKVHDGKVVSGRAYSKAPQKGFKDEVYTFDVTFSAAVAPKEKE
jgi:hypothetical protein